MTPYVGMIVQYRQRPGAVRQGQLDLAALVTRIRADDKLDLRIYVPDSFDVLIQAGVPKMSQEMQSHCWHPLEGWPDMAELRAQVEQLTADLVAAHERIDALEGGKKKDDAAKPKSRALV